MIIAYHAIFTTYGTWLPNDPRGSYSQEVYNQALKALGEIRYGRQDPQPPHETLKKFWTAARPCLARPPYFINDATRLVVAQGFAKVVSRLQLNVSACSIMNDHVHILVMRSGHRVEYLVNQFKGAATRALGLTVTPWAADSWKVFINEKDALYAAALYIQRNPLANGWAPQRWSFLTPLPLYEP